MLAVLLSVLVSAAQTQAGGTGVVDTTYDSIMLVNPYDADCRADTCVVLPSHVFRKTTIALVERNGFKSELVQRIVLDSILRVRTRIDSTIIAKQDTIIQAKTLEALALRSEITSISNAAKKDRIRYALYGLGTGIVVGVLSTLLLVMAVN
jgi:hypothetical protein